VEIANPRFFESLRGAFFLLLHVYYTARGKCSGKCWYLLTMESEVLEKVRLVPTVLCLSYYISLLSCLLARLAALYYQPVELEELAYYRLPLQHLQLLQPILHQLLYPPRIALALVLPEGIRCSSLGVLSEVVCGELSCLSVERTVQRPHLERGC